MRILLDMHLFLWAVSAASKLPTPARKHIDAAEVFVSAASIWEISIKSSIGKLDADPDELLASVEPAGFSMLPIAGEHAARVAKLPPIHKDRFDRILVAQASIEPMILLTNDEALRDYGSLITLV
ncbi:type II toxin-antitoxin system VapC family toxin [Steroidobacter flavus]|uniref:Type II toxin-antitoxin system VapC family toxin n=1 Tax=Steroidobacter flavus TaxID=1842136 RepID=A0ABV8SVK2_9GAMM